MKRRVLAMLVCSITGTMLAQSGKLEKAEKSYNQLDYSQAAEIYESLLGSEVDTPEMKERLADCYYQIGRSVESEKIYNLIASKETLNSESMYQYSQVLKENGKYAESDSWMEVYSSKQGSDSRALSFQRDKEYLGNIRNQAPFFDVQKMGINTEFSDFGGYVFEGVMYFLSSRRASAVKRSHAMNDEPFLDLYIREIEESGDQDVKLYREPNHRKFHEGPMCFTHDGKRVYFTRNNLGRGSNRKDAQGIQNLKIYTASVDEAGNWSQEMELPINSKDYSVGHPALSPDGKTLFFVSDMPGGYGGADLYKATILEDGTLGTIENLGKEINTEGQEMFPWIDGEGRLFFASDGHVGLGGLDVFFSQFNTGGSLGTIKNLGAPVNSNKDDFAFFMFENGSKGFVSSNREGGKGGDDIYELTALRKLESSLKLEGLVVDEMSNEKLVGVVVTMYSDAGELIGSCKTDENGEYTFNLDRDKEYHLSINHLDYNSCNGDITTKNREASGDGILRKDFTLNKDRIIVLVGTVSDAKTKSPLNGVQIKMHDQDSNASLFDAESSALGLFSSTVKNKENLSLQLTFDKEGYFPKKMEANIPIGDNDTIYLNEYLKSQLELDPLVTDLSDLIEINSIKFDYNKYNIRKDAAIELDKIVEIMNKYPDMVIELGSHTDCRGSYDYNKRLSAKRAEASASYIKSKITNPERIYGKGYGESKPLNECGCEGKNNPCTEEEHQENRRTEFRVIDSGKEDVDIKNQGPNSFDK